MSAQTKIAWCDSTLNPWRGCDKVSAGCANCYITTTTPFRVSGQKHGDPRIKIESFVKNALAFNRKPLICDECGGAFKDNLTSHIRADGKDADKYCCTGKSYHRRRIFSLSLGDWLDDEVPIDWLAEMLDTIRQCDQVTWILCTKRPQNWKDRITKVYSGDLATIP